MGPVTVYCASKVVLNWDWPPGRFKNTTSLLATHNANARP